jgi:hypothetical protein
MTAELTVAYIAAREGVRLPTDAGRAPRHLLNDPDEPDLTEPEPGDLSAFWFGAPTSRGERVDDATPELARPYVNQEGPPP